MIARELPTVEFTSMGSHVHLGRFDSLANKVLMNADHLLVGELLLSERTDLLAVLMFTIHALQTKSTCQQALDSLGVLLSSYEPEEGTQP